MCAGSSGAGEALRRAPVGRENKSQRHDLWEPNQDSHAKLVGRETCNVFGNSLEPGVSAEPTKGLCLEADLQA